MSSLQTLSASTSSYSRINAAISVPKLPRIIHFSSAKAQSKNLVTIPFPPQKKGITRIIEDEPAAASSINYSKATTALYAILEAVADRIEMHKNLCEQRDNWNKLMLNSINMMTLTAATLAGVAATTGGALLPLKLSSTLLFSAATGILLIMNKIQPSQLAEEQRNATRLFSQLYNQLKSTLHFHHPTDMDVKIAMDKVLALDKAYPLPLLGKMIEKFPAKLEPAVWWPKSNHLQSKSTRLTGENGWSEELQLEMREVVEVMKRKDSEDYMRLGNLVLKINKILAVSGPLLTGIAAAGSALVGNTSWAALVAVGAGAVATAVNTFEHACQVGMIVEMYRNNAGFFKHLEESIESVVQHPDMENTEDGEKVEMNVALQLGRSLSELRDLAKKSSSSRINGAELDEFASKLF